MDVLAACRVLVEVSGRGGVTRAAATLGIAQSVASRRVAALERHLGAPLLERNARAAVLTPFGRALVPTARRLVQAAEELEISADLARNDPVSVAVPETCTLRDLAVLEATARGAGFHLDLRRENPSRRAALATAGAVRIAVLAVPADAARWQVPLGAAGRRATDRPFRIEALRRRRGGRALDDDAGNRLRTSPEDSVAHVLDPLGRAGELAGLAPSQLPTDRSSTSSLASVLGDGELLLCSEAEARSFGLHWRAILDLRLVRGYALAAESPQDARSIEAAVADELAVALGVPDVA